MSGFRAARNENEGTGAIDAAVRFGPFRLWPARQLLVEGDIPVHLGARAFDLLIALVERAGEVVTKDDLVARVWPGVSVDEGNLRTQMALLRKALHDGQAGIRYLITVPGRGYRFVAPVTVVETQERNQPKSVSVEAALSLPTRLTRLIGRADAVDDIVGRLTRRRFVTITGPGGIGKTSVALAVAEQVASSYVDGVVLVDCAPLVDTSLVAGKLASILGLSIAADNPTQGLVAYLRSRRVLVVLDSCERVIEAAASLVEELLKGTTSIDILATSREPLRAEGEIVYRLPPLEIPPSSHDVAATEALSYPAVQLFVERAASSVNRFELRGAEASVVCGICRKLDGIPLAIELAAGRVDAFGTLGVAERLDDRIRLLTHGRRTALPRHRTLEATLDWSYEALSESEKMVLRRLAVFAGGFTLSAAYAVTTDDLAATIDIGDMVASLVSKSLLIADVKTVTGLYRLLDTTRAYALKKLQESGEFNQSSRRHAIYLVEQLEKMGTDTTTASIAGWLSAGPAYVDEVCAALDWAFYGGGDIEVGAALTVASLPLWTHLSHHGDCCRYGKHALRVIEVSHGQNDLEKMRLLAALGASLIYTKGPSPEASSAWAGALMIAEGLHDADYQVRVLWGMWSSHFNSGQFRAALKIGKKFREAAANSGDTSAALIGDRIVALSMFYLGDHVGARHSIETMLEHYIRPRDRSHIIRFQFDQRVVARTILARLLWALGFPDQAMHEVNGVIDEAIVVDHAMSLCLALAQAACPIALLCGDIAEAERFTNLLVGHSARHELDVWHAWGKCFSATLLIERGGIDEGLVALYRAFDELPQGAYYMRYTGFQGTLAQTLGKAGAISDGLAIIEEVIARSERDGERWYVAECLRIKGELLRLRGSREAKREAEEHLIRSIDWSRQQQTLSWELRTSISVAQLLQDQGRYTEAHDALALVYTRFKEGFQTADLKAAKDLLEQLSGKPPPPHPARHGRPKIHKN